MTRNDPHRPSAICPSDYGYMFSFSLASTVDGWPVPAINMDLVVKLRNSPGVVFSPVHSATNACDVCGAWFTHGDVWHHRPTGEYITLGHTCADKYELYANRDSWKAIRGSAIARAERYARKRQMISRCRAILADEPELRRAFRTKHYITDDIKARFLQYGEISPKQLALVIKIHNEELRRAAEPTFEPADAPVGKQTVEGTVLSTKIKETMYGDTLKMLVRVEVGDGTAWKAWGTVPAAFGRALSDRQTEQASAIDAPAHIERPPLRGCRVRFSATFKQSPDDPAFAFFTRPTKPAILEFA
jgi:hypothetical protein